MVNKDILDEFTSAEKEEERKRLYEEEKKKEETEALLEDLHKCFEEIIMPVVNEAVRDMKETGYYYKLEVGQPTSKESKKQYIRDITLYFFPEIIRDPKLIEMSFIRDYRLFFSAAKGYRGIRVSTKINKNQDFVDLAIRKVDNAAIASFIRQFIKDAIADFSSS